MQFFTHFFESVQGNTAIYARVVHNASFGPKTEPPLTAQICPVSRFKHWNSIFLYEKQNVSERTTERQNVLNLSASLSVTTV